MQRDLVIQAATGDGAAFGQLATAAFDQLFRTARLILRDDERAVDAVQDALLSAWLHIRALREPDRFDAWLRRLLVRACYREARRVSRRRVMEVSITPLETPAAGDFQGTVAMRDQLARGFRQLTVEHRAVLVMHHYLSLSDGEAAAALDIPIGTYKSRLNRAASALRAALEAGGRTPIALQEPTV